MNIKLKKYYKEGFYNYLHVSGHDCRNVIECEKEFKEIYINSKTTTGSEIISEADSFLDLSYFLVAGLEKYALAVIDYPPGNSIVTKWKYELLADDFNGMGVDKGFVDIKSSKDKAMFFELPTRLHYTNKTLWNSIFEISIFGLLKNKKKHLMDFIMQQKKPVLKNFLKDEEIFIQIVKRNGYGYFNAVLIKSKKELDDVIYGYFNTTDAGN